MQRFANRLALRAFSATSRRAFAAEASVAELPQAINTAGRYANALYRAAHKMKSMDAVTADVLRLQTMQSTIPAFNAFMQNPTLPRSAKVDTLSEILKRAEFSAAFSQFLMVMAENGRTVDVEKALVSFQDIVASLKGEVICKVTTTEPLTDWELALLKKKIKQSFFADTPDTDVMVETAFDDELLGGLTIQVGDRFMDLSTRTELRKLQETISSSLS